MLVEFDNMVEEFIQVFVYVRFGVIVVEGEEDMFEK